MLLKWHGYIWLGISTWTKIIITYIVLIIHLPEQNAKKTIQDARKTIRLH
jgi:hypothetical protein